MRADMSLSVQASDIDIAFNRARTRAHRSGLRAGHPPLSLLVWPPGKVAAQSVGCPCMASREDAAELVRPRYGLHLAGTL